MPPAGSYFPSIILSLLDNYSTLSTSPRGKLLPLTSLGFQTGSNSRCRSTFTVRLTFSLECLVFCMRKLAILRLTRSGNLRALHLSESVCRDTRTPYVLCTATEEDWHSALRMMVSTTGPPSHDLLRKRTTVVDLYLCVRCGCTVASPRLFKLCRLLSLAASKTISHLLRGIRLYTGLISVLLRTLTL